MASCPHAALCRARGTRATFNSVYSVGRTVGHNVGVAEGYEQLRLAVMNGGVKRAGRSHERYVHPLATHTKMARDKMRNASETFPRSTLERHYLGCCWIPRDMATAWCSP